MRGASAAAAVLRAAPRPAAFQLSPRLRKRLGLALLALLMAGSLYMLWIRDLGFLRVDRVTVTGLTAEDGDRLRTALGSAARGMTTLHVRHDRLERVAAAYPTVESIEVQPDFPNGMRIHVVEHRPVALAVAGGAHVPVAGDGTLLRGIPVEGSVPEIRLRERLHGGRLGRGTARAAVRVAAAAPGALLGRIERVSRSGRRGYVASLRNGPDLIFGDLTRLGAKWAAAARVLADEGSKGATYIDLRLTDRPAAGGLPVETVAPVAPADETATGQAPVGTTPGAPPGAAGAQTPAPPAPAVPAAPQQATPEPQATTPPATGAGGAPSTGAQP